MDLDKAISVVSTAMNVSVLNVERMTFTHSGNLIYSLELPERSVILRTSAKSNTFEFTERNIDVMRELGLPVPKVAASGRVDLTEPWTSIILDRIQGRDLYYELENMSPRQVTRLAEQIVTFQAAVGTLPLGRGYGWGQIGEGGPDPAWFYIFRDQSEAAPPNSDGSLLAECRVRVHQHTARLQPYLRAVKPVCFLDDLTTKNAIVKDGTLQGIIDLDYVCFGDALWTIGGTGGCIVSDLGPEQLFYFEELCRFAELNDEERQAVNLYAAIRALEFLEMAVADNDEVRVERLAKAIEDWTEG